jgi:hypothetical protein
MSSPPVSDLPQSSVRHLVMVELFARRVVPPAPLQIGPQDASVIVRHPAIDAFRRSEQGEHIDMVVKDQEAGPTGGRAVARAHPFHPHDASTQRIAVASKWL